MKVHALEAGRAAFRKETGFVMDGLRIPVFENLCFCLALCRSRIGANVLEAKAILEKLIPFFTNEGFPRFIHSYPKASTLPFELPLMYLERDFGHVLKLDLNRLLHQLPAPEPLTFQDSLHPDLLVPVAVDCPQRGFEPELTLDQLFCGKVIEGHPLLLYGALLDESFPLISKKPALMQREDGTRFIWGTKENVHSLYMRDPLEGLFVDTRTSVLINGEKSTTFQIGDEIEIETKEGIITAIFTCKEGRFIGHLSRKNRPFQVLKDKAYDYCLYLRTLEPSNDPKIQLTLDYQPKDPSHEDHCLHTALHQ